MQSKIFTRAQEQATEGQLDRLMDWGSLSRSSHEHQRYSTRSTPAKTAMAPAM